LYPYQYQYGAHHRRAEGDEPLFHVTIARKKKEGIMERDLLRLLQACVGIVVLLATTLLVFGLFPSMSSEAGAAWIQAVGSIGAILSAIWVMSAQNRAAEKRDREEIRHFLLALRDEIYVLATAFAERSGKSLLERDDGAFFLKIPVTEAAFAIYNSSADKVGRVKNDILRQNIVITYARAFGFIKTIQMNNHFLEEYERAHWAALATGNPVDVQYRDARFRVLDEYGTITRKAYRELVLEVNSLLASFQSHQ